MPPTRTARALAAVSAVIALSVALATATNAAASLSHAGGSGLPTDWPAGLPVPPGGVILGSAGSRGQWSVLILMRGSASDVLLAAHDFYATAGFTPDSNATLHDTSYRIVLVAENRDHSASETQLVVAVSGIPPTPGAPALKARILRGPHRIGLAAARRSGLQVAFIAPAAARLAIVHAFRKIGAGRRAIGSRSDAVHAGRNVIALDSPSFRNALRPGRYQVEIVLRATAGGPGEPVRVPVVIR